MAKIEYQGNICNFCEHNKDKIEESIFFLLSLNIFQHKPFLNDLCTLIFQLSYLCCMLDGSANFKISHPNVQSTGKKMDVLNITGFTLNSSTD